jgi:hypothetical protein
LTLETASLKNWKLTSSKMNFKLKKLYLGTVILILIHTKDTRNKIVPYTTLVSVRVSNFYPRRKSATKQFVHCKNKHII